MKTINRLVISMLLLGGCTFQEHQNPGETGPGPDDQAISCGEICETKFIKGNFD